MPTFEFGTWWQFGLFSSFMAAGFLLVNQHYKLRSSTLMLWRGFGVAAVFAPFMFYAGLPTDPMFYYAVVAQGIIVSIHDRLSIESTARFGAGITSRLLPVGIWITFVLWLFMKPAYRASLFDNPEKLLAVCVALFVAVIAMFFIRKDAISKEAALFLLPCVLFFGLIDIFNKTAMDAAGDAVSGAYAYGCLMSLVVGVCTVIFRRFSEHKKVAFAEAFQGRALKCGLILIIFMVTAMFAKNIAMFGTANPAYVGLLALSCPIWIAGYNRVVGHQDKTNLWAGMLFVLSAALLIAFTR